jgi:hypothetical protein
MALNMHAAMSRPGERGLFQDHYDRIDRLEKTVNYIYPKEEGFNSCSVAKNLETLVTNDWAKINGSHKLTKFVTNRLNLRNSTVNGTVTTGDKKLEIFKTKVIGVVTTSSRDVVIKDSVIGKLVILVPKDDSVKKSRKLKLINTRVDEIIIHNKLRVVDVITKESTVSSMKIA